MIVGDGIVTRGQKETKRKRRRHQSLVRSEVEEKTQETGLGIKPANINGN